MEIEPVTLEGEFVRLEPLATAHLERLCEVGLDESLWRLTTVNVENQDDMANYINSALADQKSGAALPFVTIEKSSGKLVGSTRFGNIDKLNRRAEIGWTWINSNWQRTQINTEAKLLMLTHAFENWEMIRVELKTDELNEKSQNAIRRIGAKQEGIFRNHLITYSGRLRNSVYFSIIDSEWATVKKNLSEKLAKR